jgi:hypothetical protein
MLEQVVNFKKRYQALVEKYTLEDFEAYFAEFFARHTCVKAVLWSQEDDASEFLLQSPEFDITPGYLSNHPAVVEHILATKLTRDDSPLFETYSVEKKDKEQYPELYEAVLDIRKLFEGRDVFKHVFKTDVDVVAHPKTGIVIIKWGE